MGQCVVSVERVGWRRWRWAVADLLDRHGHFQGVASSRSEALRAAEAVTSQLVVSAA